MSASGLPYREPSPGCYRLGRGIRLVARVVGGQERYFAVWSYPVRVVPLSASLARLLALCVEERNCEQLSYELRTPLKRVEALCDQLRWKGMLETGLLLPPANWPAVSIIVPTYNRMYDVERCLRSLLALHYPLSMLEVVVVDDASTDETSSMLAAMMAEARELGLDMRVVCHPTRRGVAAARNTGAAQARYDLIAYIDSDCLASPDWLTDLVPAFLDPQVAAVGGMIRAADRVALLGRYEDVCSSLFMGVRPQLLTSEGPLTYLPTANLLVRRVVWRQLNGFSPLTFGEDVDFCRRLLSSGSTIHYLPHGVVYHNYRTHLLDFLRIRASYASSEAALMQRHPAERRILLLPPEQATFAASSLAGVGSVILALVRSLYQRLSTTRPSIRGSSRAALPLIIALLAMIASLLLTMLGTSSRLKKMHSHRLPATLLSPRTIFIATLRGHLSYSYHLCRHLTRYYTLPLLALCLLIPPLLIFVLLLCGIVMVVDYVRLGPEMPFFAYAFCSLAEDCAYEVGVLLGCIKHRTWKPLVPIIRKRPVKRTRDL